MPTRSGPPPWGLGMVLTAPHCKTGLVMKLMHVPWPWKHPLVQHKQWKRDVRFGTWNVRSLYRSWSLTTVAREFTYKSDLVGVLEVRWDKGGTIRAGDYIFFYGKGNKNHRLGTRFFVHCRIVSAVDRVEFVSDRMSYIVLRGRWSDIIVLNVHAPSEEKSDESKDSFCEE